MDEELEGLDGAFVALANRHRREILRLVSLQPYAISRLADLRGLSLPAINKHIAILEGAGMVRRRKLGRTTFLTLDRSSIRAVQAWLGEFHAHWGTDDETLENYGRPLAAASAEEVDR